MQRERVLAGILFGHFLALAIIYLPFAFQRMDQLGFLAPAMLNALLILVSFIVSLIASIVPRWRKYCGYWWLSFGAVLLASFPVCLGTMQLNSAFTS